MSMIETARGGRSLRMPASSITSSQYFYRLSSDTDVYEIRTVSDLKTNTLTIIQIA